MKITTCPEHSGSTNGTHTRTFTPTQGFVRVKYSASAVFSLANASLNSVDVDTVYTVLARGSYRYGFNGMEKDDEVKDQKGASYDFGARMYDSRLGRFLSLDAYSRLSSNASLYQVCGNDPINSIDKNGDYKYPAGSNYEKTYPVLTNYLKNNVQDILDNPKIMKAMMKYGQFTKEQLAEIVTWGKGPVINIVDLEGAYGEFTPGIGSNEIRINKGMVKRLEKAISKAEKRKRLLIAGITILHETVHYGDDKDGKDYDATDVDPNGEEGNAFEITVYGQVMTDENVGEYLEKNKNISDYNPNIQHVGKVVFDSNKAEKREDGYLDVKDLVSGKQYAVKRNENGSYSFKK